MIVNVVGLKVYLPATLLAIGLLVSILLPPFSLSLDIAVYLTVVALLFTILVGFFIATATSNYLRLQSLIAEEDGSLITLYNLTKLIQPEATDHITRAIDRYMIAALNFEVTDYIDETQQPFDQLTEAVNNLQPKDATVVVLLSNLQSEVGQLFSLRQEVALTSRRIVGKGHWTILILLALLLNTLILGLRGEDLMSHFLTAVLMVATYLILLLVYEVDSNRFWEEKLSYENSERVFDTMKLLRYYPQEAFKKKRVKEPQVNYRLGILTNPTNPLTRQIKVIEKE